MGGVRNLDLDMKVIDLYNQGLPVKEVATQCGIVYCTVAKIVNLYPGKVKKRYRKATWIDPAKDVIQQLREMGRLKEVLETGCIEADVYMRPNGYPEVMVNRKHIYLHRLALLQKESPPPGKDYACHRCNNPKCFNPDHLYWGTPKENSEDMVEAGRSPKGERQGLSKLKESQVRELRQLRRQGMTYEQLGKMYGIAVCTVGQIVNRRTWKHVD